MAEVKWIKIAIDIFDNEKIRIIEKMPEGGTVLLIWLKLLTLAGKKNDGGYIYLAEKIPYTPEQLGDLFGYDSRIITIAIQTFITFNMITLEEEIINVVNWGIYQNIEGLELIREQNRTRQRRYKEKKRLKQVNVTQTLGNGSEENKDNEKEREFEKWWTNYPRHTRKKETLAVYLSMNNLPELEKHIAVVSDWKKTEEWLEKEGAFVPSAIKWLQGERWNDVPPINSNDPNQKSATSLHPSDKENLDKNARGEFPFPESNLKDLNENVPWKSDAP